MGWISDAWDIIRGDYGAVERRQIEAAPVEREQGKAIDLVSEAQRRRRQREDEERRRRQKQAEEDQEIFQRRQEAAREAARKKQEDDDRKTIAENEAIAAGFAARKKKSDETVAAAIAANVAAAAARKKKQDDDAAAAAAAASNNDNNTTTPPPETPPVVDPQDGTVVSPPMRPGGGNDNMGGLPHDVSPPPLLPPPPSDSHDSKEDHSTSSSFVPRADGGATIQNPNGVLFQVDGSGLSLLRQTLAVSGWLLQAGGTLVATFGAGTLDAPLAAGGAAAYTLGQFIRDNGDIYAPAAPSSGGDSSLIQTQAKFLGNIRNFQHANSAPSGVQNQGVWNMQSQPRSFQPQTQFLGGVGGAMGSPLGQPISQSGVRYQVWQVDPEESLAAFAGDPEARAKLQLDDAHTQYSFLTGWNSEQPAYARMVLVRTEYDSPRWVFRTFLPGGYIVDGSSFLALQWRGALGAQTGRTELAHIALRDDGCRWLIRFDHDGRGWRQLPGDLTLLYPQGGIEHQPLEIAQARFPPPRVDWQDAQWIVKETPRLTGASRPAQRVSYDENRPSAGEYLRGIPSGAWIQDLVKTKRRLKRGYGELTFDGLLPVTQAVTKPRLNPSVHLAHLTELERIHNAQDDGHIPNARQLAQPRLNPHEQHVLAQGVPARYEAMDIDPQDNNKLLGYTPSEAFVDSSEGKYDEEMTEARGGGQEEGYATPARRLARILTDSVGKQAPRELQYGDEPPAVPPSPAAFSPEALIAQKLKNALLQARVEHMMTAQKARRNADQEIAEQNRSASKGRDPTGRSNRFR